MRDSRRNHRRQQSALLQGKIAADSKGVHIRAFLVKSHIHFIGHGQISLMIMNLLIQNRRKPIFGKEQDGKKLTLEQIAKLGGIIPIGVISSGRLPLMLTRNCPAMNDGKGCKHCKTAPYIRDRKGIDFPMKCFGSCTEILNSVPLCMADKRSQMTGIDFEVIHGSSILSCRYRVSG